MYGGVQRKKILYMVAEWASQNNRIKHLLFYVYLNYISTSEKESWFEVYYRKTLNIQK